MGPKFWPVPMSHGHMSPDLDGDGDGGDVDNGDKDYEEEVNWIFS